MREACEALTAAWLTTPAPERAYAEINTYRRYQRGTGRATVFELHNAITGARTKLATVPDRETIETAAELLALIANLRRERKNDSHRSSNRMGRDGAAESAA